MSMFRAQSPVLHLPKINLQSISLNDMDKKVRASWQWRDVDLEDNVFYYPSSLEEWGAIYEYLQKNMPAYVIDAFDCDNFAGWMRHECARLFRCNTLAEVEGWVYLGRGVERHAWCWGYLSDGFHQWEPQTNMIMKIYDPLYVADEIEMG